MAKIYQNVIEEIVSRILKQIRPERIILFGSAASGKMTKDSDVDLLVLKKRPLDPRKESVRIRKCLKGMPYPFDIVVMARQRFEETKNIIGGLAYPANKYGKVIYEAR